MTAGPPTEPPILSQGQESDPDPTAGLPPDLVRVLRDPTITFQRDHEIRLADGRTLFEHIEEWRNAPSNTASALPPPGAVTDPAVSPFDLIRDALLHCTLNDYTGPALAALDQLQRDHETLADGFKRNLRLGTEEIRAERDAAVREAETLRFALEEARQWIAVGCDHFGSDEEVVEYLDAALASSRDTTETT